MGFFSRWTRKRETNSPEKNQTQEQVKILPDSPQPADWQQSIQAALSQVEPRLSVWLPHVLNGVETKGDELWQRLRFFFHCLAVEEHEAQDFITRFEVWLEDMGYERVEKF